MKVPKIGDPYRCIPAGLVGLDEQPGMRKTKAQEITGRVESINLAHRFFTVGFDVNGHHLTESFKF